MLAELQKQLHEIYQTAASHDVRHFLVTDVNLARMLSRGAMINHTAESLLMCQEGDGLSLSLYLDDALLKRLESANPLEEFRPEQLGDLCMVIEGLSHFNYVVWKASQDRTVSLLELELQAEIDKFVSMMQLAREQRSTDLLHGLFRRLFDMFRLRHDLDPAQSTRYREANDYAARFCRRLRPDLLTDSRAALAELRQFYRLQLPDKISYIHSNAWSGG